MQREEGASLKAEITRKRPRPACLLLPPTFTLFSSSYQALNVLQLQLECHAHKSEEESKYHQITASIITMAPIGSCVAPPPFSRTSLPIIEPLFRRERGRLLPNRLARLLLEPYSSDSNLVAAHSCLAQAFVRQQGHRGAIGW